MQRLSLMRYGAQQNHIKAHCTKIWSFALHCEPSVQKRNAFRGKTYGFKYRRGVTYKKRTKEGQSVINAVMDRYVTLLECTLISCCI